MVFVQPPAPCTLYVVVAVGLTIIEEPLPKLVPLQLLPVYHLHAAPVCKLPPTTLSVTAAPLATVAGDAVALSGFVDVVVIANATPLLVPEHPALLVAFTVYVPAIDVE
jgi:hypothetical protein